MAKEASQQIGKGRMMSEEVLKYYHHRSILNICRSAQQINGFHYCRCKCWQRAVCIERCPYGSGRGDGKPAWVILGKAPVAYSIKNWMI